MKIIKNVILNGQEVDLQQEHIVLELNNAGRGFITVKTEQDCVGKSVVFEMGEYDAYYKWFDGFVEQEQSAENGYKRLFIREKVAVFERPLNCSHRHITLKALCEWLTNERGLPFRVPDEIYSNNPIPLFTHTGSGYQLLHNIGRQFQVPNFMWQQSPDGSVFVGAWEHSRWVDRPVDVESGDTLQQMSNSITIPISARIRPGSLVNGKRIKKVILKGDEYVLEWDDLKKDGTPKQKSPERRAVEKEFPELAGGYHLPKYAKIVAVADPANAGDISDPFRPKYAVDIQLLDENGKEDSTIPVYPAVPLPITSPSSQGGDFAYPEVGTVVEIGFVNGRSDQPIVRNFFAHGKTIPSIAPNEMLRQQRPEVFERTDAAGNMYKQTDQAINEKSFSRNVETDSELKTLGTAQKHVDADNSETVGGNKTTHVIGNIQEVTASNKSVGVGGDLNEKIQGVAKQISEVENKLVAPLSYVGTEEQNIFRILENLLQIVADLANTVSSHTHRGGPEPDQKSIMSGYSSQATQAKGKLTPIIS
ncbi:hypothetical protein ACWIUA_00560 [Ursidibacter sp. B-7004-1]